MSPLQSKEEMVGDEAIDFAGSTLPGKDVNANWGAKREEIVFWMCHIILYFGRIKIKCNAIWSFHRNEARLSFTFLSFMYVTSCVISSTCRPTVVFRDSYDHLTSVRGWALQPAMKATCFVRKWLAKLKSKCSIGKSFVTGKQIHAPNTMLQL